MPVFPAVASMIVPPGRSCPSSSASRNDPDRRAVFHTSARVQVLQLCEHFGAAGRRQLLQLQHGSFADELRDVVGDAETGSWMCGAHSSD